MTIEIVHKYTSAGDKALELQYWGLGEPGTRLTLGGARRPPEQQASSGTSTRGTWRGEGAYTAREAVQVYHTSTTAIVHAKYMWFSFMVVIITLLLPRAAQRCPPRHYTTFCNGCDPDHSALGRCHVVFAELMATAMPCTCLVLRDASLLPASMP